MRTTKRDADVEPVLRRSPHESSRAVECTVAQPARLDIERIKTVALSTGVSIAEDVLAHLGGPEHLTIHEYATTGGITLVLEGEVFVNAPFDEPFCSGTPLRLVRGRPGLDLELGDATVAVERVLPLPGYLGTSDARGRAVRDTVMSHADRIRVAPIVGCVYDCHFCDLAPLRYRPRPVEQLLSAIDVALEDTALLPVRHLLISGGSPARAHYEYFDTTCAAVADHVRDVAPAVEVDVMMSARPDGAKVVERLVDAGIRSFSLNLELFAPSAANEYLPLKHKHAREHLQSMITRAVELLGRGTGRVRSLIIPGLEPVEATVAGVEWLASLGCHPVISPFRPARGTRLADASPPAPETLAAVLEESREIVRAHGITLGPHCLPCQHNTLTFPWDVPANATLR